MSKIGSLQNCVALVTGAASGLGRATVQRLANKGAKVVLCDLSDSQGSIQREGKPFSLTKEYWNAAPPPNWKKNICFAPTDVRSEYDVAAAVKMAEDRFGGLNTVVNCAGVARTFATYNHNTRKPCQQETFVDNYEVNSTGSFNVIRLAVELMMKNEPNVDGQRGVIINTGCIVATDGGKAQQKNAASKGAIAGMTLPIARDLAPHGIRCVTISPGYMDTYINAHLPAKVREFLARMCAFPLTLGDPIAFAHAVQMVYENPMLNGEVIRLDAGARPVV